MRYYFLGIGGIGMSALARYFHRRGDEVSGYDRTPSPLTEELESEGIAVHYDDASERIPEGVDLVVYTPAVPQELAEFQALKASGVPMKKRSQVLGELTQGKHCIAVAGSHGKTTTTTMIAHLLSKAPCGCTAFLGGIGKNFDSNLWVDAKSDYVVVEADEYDRSFLQLHPYMAVITATDPDHLDIYGTHEAMMDAYVQFANQTADDGRLFIKEGVFQTSDGEPYVEYGHEHHDHHHEHGEHHDHAPHPALHAPLSTYTAHGIEVDYYAINVRTYNGNLFFDLRTPDGVLFDLEIDGTALFNVENAVAASAVALSCGLDQYQLRQGLKTFAGVRRRFDYRIREKSLVYIDDYAHHPKEIASTLESIRYLYPGKRVVGIFQPHLYSRTRDLADDFARVLGSLDELIMMPIYPAREKPILGVTSSMVLHKVDSMSKYLCTPDQVLELVPALCPDVVVTLGAGDIDRLVPRLEQVLREQVL
ncbi:MAG: UDP-N-acetylmuramate--L-alanine ligase [Bacteroidales bacterium]|nr:UDP-N-acetylmuramate--L-alanine ligase [Bacteroidales bacterium]